METLNYTVAPEDKNKPLNIWRSTCTGACYGAPLDWMPRFGGWELIGTVRPEPNKS